MFSSHGIILEEIQKLRPVTGEQNVIYVLGTVDCANQCKWDMCKYDMQNVFSVCSNYNYKWANLK